MKLLLATIFLVLLQCSLHLSADCPKSRFAVGKRRTTGNKRYRIGLSVNDSSDATIKLSVINSADLTKGQTNIQSRDLTLVKSLGGVYEFKLNNLGKAKLTKKKANPSKNQFILVDVVFNHRKPPFPRVQKFTLGDFSCSVPIKKRVCNQLTKPCKNYRIPIGGQRGNEVGVLMLKPVSAGLRNWQVVVGFETEVDSLLLNQKADLVSQECGKIFTFKNPVQQQRRRRGSKRVFPYTLGYNANNSPPKISYIFYGNKICNTSCGTKPVCPVTTPQPEPTTTQAPVVETTTIAPEEETTVQPPVEETTTQAPVEETTTLAPVEETTTMAPMEETTTLAPVEETTTLAPIEETTTQAPVEETTTEAPVEETTTLAPVEETTTLAPVEETTTEAPVEETTTLAPVEETTTLAPVEETTTLAPVEETTTQAPVEETTTLAPIEETTTQAPVEETTTLAPEEVTTELPTDITFLDEDDAYYDIFDDLF